MGGAAAAPQLPPPPPEAAGEAMGREGRAGNKKEEFPPL
jgi:hypothetical protein